MSLIFTHDRCTVETLPRDGFLNVSGTNAVVLFALLGVEFSEYGSLSLVLARRALMRGRSRDLSRFEREPFTAESGSGERRECRAMVLGLSAARMLQYLDTFEMLIRDAIARDASEIRWS